MQSNPLFFPAVVVATCISAGLAHGAIAPPVLKWGYGGCFASWCETGWYASPAVADLDNDGVQEVLGSAYSIVALRGETGELLWRVDSGHDRSAPDGGNVGRTWPGLIISDIDADARLEIISAHGGGYVSVYDQTGTFKPGWPKHPVAVELRGLMVSDLDNDGKQEIIVTAAGYSKTNIWVYDHDGNLRPGWPQLADDSGYAYGVFNDNAWVADLDGDRHQEIIVPSDVHYICAYDARGNQLPTNERYGEKGWGQVGLWESPATELRGWGDCASTRQERYRSNMAHGAAVADDLDGNGTMEIVVTGNMYDCNIGHPPGKYTPLFLLNADRSRFSQNGWDWQEPAKDTGAPLSEDYATIEHCQPNPVVVDLDGDGIKEILFASYDGRLHAFWLDKTEHHAWPYSVYDPGEGFFRFASEPVIADLDGDSRAEVIFTSWPQKTTASPLRLGRVHILDYQGRLLHEIDLPAPKSSSLQWNGALAAPTLADIDGDPDLELVVNTVYSGLVAYDLPNSANARILWRSGRNKGFSAPREPLPATVAPLLLLLLK